MFKMDFAFIKYSSQGRLTVKNRDGWQIIFITENHRHLPIAIVNDPLVVCLFFPFF